MLKHFYGAISQVSDSFQGLVKLWKLLREVSFGQVLGSSHDNDYHPLLCLFLIKSIMNL